MAESYTVFWPQLRCRRMLLHDMAGARLTVLFGGPHLSQPSFQRAGVQGEGIVQQIDGVIELSGVLDLVEAKWWKEPLGVPEAAPHLVRVHSRPPTTRSTTAR